MTHRIWLHVKYALQRLGPLEGQAGGLGTFAEADLPSSNQLQFHGTYLPASSSPSSGSLFPQSQQGYPPSSSRDGFSAASSNSGGFKPRLSKSGEHGLFFRQLQPDLNLLVA